VERSKASFGEKYSGRQARYGSKAGKVWEESNQGMGIQQARYGDKTDKVREYGRQGMGVRQERYWSKAENVWE
jgi:hypothetical protein